MKTATCQNRIIRIGDRVKRKRIINGITCWETGEVIGLKSKGRAGILDEIQLKYQIVIDYAERLLKVNDKEAEQNA